MVFGLSCGVYAEIEEARIDVHNTVPEVCGDGGGLNPCRDVDGETFEQELDVNTTPGLDSNQQLEAQVEKLKHESLEREIEELERR
jgi:hypothetical protein